MAGKKKRHSLVRLKSFNGKDYPCGTSGKGVSRQLVKAPSGNRQ